LALHELAQRVLIHTSHYRTAPAPGAARLHGSSGCSRRVVGRGALRYEQWLA
jgi:hypothetical protein